MCPTGAGRIEELVRNSEALAGTSPRRGHRDVIRQAESMGWARQPLTARIVTSWEEKVTGVAAGPPEGLTGWLQDLAAVVAAPPMEDVAVVEAIAGHYLAYHHCRPAGAGDGRVARVVAGYVASLSRRPLVVFRPGEPLPRVREAACLYFARKIREAIIPFTPGDIPGPTVERCGGDALASRFECPPGTFMASIVEWHHLVAAEERWRESAWPALNLSPSGRYGADPAAPPGWYADPSCRHDERAYASRWTGWVRDSDRPGRDPTPPGPGTRTWWAPLSWLTYDQIFAADPLANVEQSWRSLAAARGGLEPVKADGLLQAVDSALGSGENLAAALSMHAPDGAVRSYLEEVRRRLAAWTPPVDLRSVP